MESEEEKRRRVRSELCALISAYGADILYNTGDPVYNMTELKLAMSSALEAMYGLDT